MRAVAHHCDLAQRLGLLARGGGQQGFHRRCLAHRREDAQHITAGAVDRFQRGGILDHLQRLRWRMCQHHARVAHQRHHRGGAVQHVAPVMRLVAADGARHAGIPRFEPVVLGDPGQWHRLRLAPAARAAHLLERLDRARHAVGVQRQRPQQAPGLGAGGGFGAGQCTQCCQRLLPVRARRGAGAVLAGFRQVVMAGMCGQRHGGSGVGKRATTGEQQEMASEMRQTPGKEDSRPPQRLHRVVTHAPAAYNVVFANLTALGEKTCRWLIATARFGWTAS
ncbi:hypothetical protein D9M72_458680 [compost metagenome]